ncbi:ribonuclease HIII [Geobacillus subterraneus]|uniref:Ribonuclease HIII n=2 Tax=Geobacillus TaxID=129337 RepID=A0ABM6A8Y2_9BACL|nr:MULTISPECIES: ribonuclease HIII [Geobacillus]AMX82677.1 ribonuclease HIII [Geobacillus subterraneus]KZS26241.1 ribonuclease HIII [Geobacillus subterraneus]OXB90769.1 ribonuclease HIII [Geobacillus uzenensis]QIZ68599.1 ribonuclease HIII [Geobacillus subterraneus]WPZ17625.1 ribonuclease HIII [Geobacillus subterraneus]
MSNYVIQADQQLLAALRAHYENALSDRLPPGALFAVKRPDVTITAYRSGKVLFQGKAAEQEAAKWMGEQGADPAKRQRRESTSPPLEHRLAKLSAIGSDEVGTGDYFGPIVVAAAYVDRSHIANIAALGVRDSKQLNDEAIKRIAPAIMKTAPYAVTVLTNAEYNRWQRSGMPQTKMKALLHNRTLAKLVDAIAPIEPEAIIIDQFLERDSYFRYLAEEDCIVHERVHCLPKAESVHVAVAAASIIARYVFLEEMERLSRTTGFPLPKGAGAVVDEAAARIIRLRGEEMLETCAKLHFANTKKALAIAKRR